MESEHAMMFRKLRGVVMDTIAIRNSSIAFGINEDLKHHFKEIGRISFDANKEDVENYELPIEDSESLPRTKEVAKSIKKILNRLINNWIVTSPLTLDIYDSFIDAYETDPDFKPQGKILEILALTYDCYIQAYLTDISSKPNFWIETPELSQQKHLENFQSLLEWRLKNSFKISFVDRISLFLSLTSSAYGINVGDLIGEYRNNIDLYIQNISNILIENATSNSKASSSFEKNNAKNAGLLRNDNFSSNLLTHHFIERTPEETAEGLQKIAKSFKRQQKLWNSMTEDEQAISNAEFLLHHEKLSRSRSE